MLKHWYDLVFGYGCFIGGVNVMAITNLTS